jgi:hypothetical protein
MLALNDSPSQVGDLSSPFDDPKSWDTVQIGALKWYGKFEIKRAKRKYKWDVKDASGQEGATETYRGKRPEVFSIQFFIWTDLMWTNWKIFQLAFQYSGIKGLVIPVDIVHPGINLTGISQIVCEDLGALEKVSDDQMWSVTVNLREYFPPLPLNATDTPPGAATTSPTGTPGPVPNPAFAALQAKIAALQAQAAALGSPGGLPG